MPETSISPSPNHAIFILVIVVGILILPWCLPEESESFFPSFEEMNPLIMLAPVILLLVVRFLASAQSTGLGIEADAASIHRVSGSSVGLAVVLVVVVAMIWYQSAFQESLSGGSSD